MKKGFTLLEVLVAVLILSAAVLAVFQAFGQGFRSLAGLQTTEEMSYALANILEEIDRVRVFEPPPKRTGNMSGFEYEWTASPDGPRRRVIGFNDVLLAYEAGMYKFVLTIYYNGRDGRRRSREFVIHKMGWANVGA